MAWEGAELGHLPDTDRQSTDTEISPEWMPPTRPGLSGLIHGTAGTVTRTCTSRSETQRTLLGCPQKPSGRPSQATPAAQAAITFFGSTGLSSRTLTVSTVPGGPARGESETVAPCEAGVLPGGLDAAVLKLVGRDAV